MAAKRKAVSFAPQSLALAGGGGPRGDGGDDAAGEGAFPAGERARKRRRGPLARRRLYYK